MPYLILGILIIYVVVKIVIWIIESYVGFVRWMFVDAGPYILAVGAAVMTIIVLVNYVRAMGRNLFFGPGWADGPDGPEPAFRQYFFRKAYHDYAAIVRDSSGFNVGVAEVAFNGVKVLFTKTGWGAAFTWPLGVIAFGILGAGAVAAAASYVAFGATHLLLVLALCAVAVMSAATFRLAEYGSMLWRRIFLACPNAGCYRKLSLPVYLCPACGARHGRLIPGSYGIFRRRCRCGEKLPTLFLFGRSKLPALCPHEACGRPINAEAGTVRNVHVPVVGGPAAGKTSFLMANMCELDARAAGGELTLRFPEPKDQALFERCRSAFASGDLVPKTAEQSPDAFLVRVNDGDARSVLLYVYDAAGELYEQTDVLRTHEYYTYLHGILFLVDPFSLLRLQSDERALLTQRRADLKPSQERPQDVYDRMIGTLRGQAKLGRRFQSQPFCVVVTKGDALGADLGTSAAVRAWLEEHGEGNLVRSIEHDFKEVRYFCCSALGRMPDGSAAPFTPDGTLAPLAWVLSRQGVTLRADPVRQEHRS